jgi:DNA processing protein
MLIRDGATLVRNAEDIIDALTPAAVQAPAPALDLPEPAPRERPLRDIAALHSQILSRLSASPIAEDQLLRDIKVTATDVAPVLIDLELDGKITRHSGGLLARVV